MIRVVVIVVLFEYWAWRGIFVVVDTGTVIFIVRIFSF